MSDPYIGEIRIFAFDFAPLGWATCQGQLLPISSNTTLFAILGTTYGGNGVTTFALPDLRGRVPIHPGQGPGLSFRGLGEVAGAENVALVANQLPAHTHTAKCFNDIGNDYGPSGVVWAMDAGGNPEYGTTKATSSMAADAIGPSGSGQPHNNMQPSLVLNYCICMFGGAFPPLGS